MVLNYSHVKYSWLVQIGLIIRNFISGYNGFPKCWRIDGLCSVTTTVRVVGQICCDGVLRKEDASLNKCGKINVSN